MPTAPGAPPKRGVVAVIPRADGRLILIQRSEHVRAPGKYCFPGGTIEPGEEEPAAVVRELREELDLDVRPVRFLWSYRTEWGTDLAWWLARADESAPLRPNPAEVAWAGWMTVEEIEALPDLLPGNLRFFEAYRSGLFSISISS